MKTSVIIPTLNEEANIFKLIKILKKNKQLQIIFSDDGSKDKTQALAKKARAFVLDRTGKMPGLTAAVLDALNHDNRLRINGKWVRLTPGYIGGYTLPPEESYFLSTKWKLEDIELIQGLASETRFDVKVRASISFHVKEGGVESYLF